MRKVIYSLATAAIALGMTACGGKKTESPWSEEFQYENEEEYDGGEEEEEKMEIPESAIAKIDNIHFEDDEMQDMVRLKRQDYELTYADFAINTTVQVFACDKTDKKVSYLKLGFYDENGNKLESIQVFDGIEQLNAALEAGDIDNAIDLPVSFTTVGRNSEAKFMNAVKYIKGEAIYSDSEGDDENTHQTLAEANAEEEVEEVIEEVVEETPATNPNKTFSNAKDLKNSPEYKQFIADGKSGDIDKMIRAYVWLGKQEAAIKSQVRALNETAIEMAVALDQANEEIGEKYDSFTISGALNNMTDKMSNAQLTAYNKACADEPLYFTANDMDLSMKYAEKYRKIRYNSPF